MVGTAKGMKKTTQLPDLNSWLQKRAARIQEGMEMCYEARLIPKASTAQNKHKECVDATYHVSLAHSSRRNRNLGAKQADPNQHDKETCTTT